MKSQINEAMQINVRKAHNILCKSAFTLLLFIKNRVVVLVSITIIPINSKKKPKKLKVRRLVFQSLVSAQ